MCASANSLIGPNFKPMFTCTDAIVHQFHAVNAWHRNCYLSRLSFVTFDFNLWHSTSITFSKWHPLIRCRIFSLFSIGFSVYFCTISVSLHSFSICLDAYCLYHQSALVTFAFVIINDYWIRKKVNCPSLLPRCIKLLSPNTKRRSLVTERKIQSK